MKLYILRHGEAQDDIRNTYGGAADDTLTLTGKKQAKLMAQQLKLTGLQIIFCSPLLRARETAEIISRELGNITLAPLEDLRERNSYGVLSGVNKDLAKSIFGYILQNLKEKPGYSKEPLLGSEDFDLFIQRVNKAFKEIITYAKNNKVETLAIVSHGVFTRALFEYILEIGDIKLEPNEIIMLDYIEAQVNFKMLGT